MVWKLLASSHCILKHSPKGDLWSQNSSWCFPLNETPCMPCFLHRWLHVAIFSQRMLPMYLDHIWTSFLAQVFPTVHLDILQVQGEYQSMCNRLHYPDGKEFADYWSLWPHWMGQPILPKFWKDVGHFWPKLVPEPICEVFQYLQHIVQGGLYWEFPQWWLMFELEVWAMPESGLSSLVKKLQLNLLSVNE